MTLKDVESVRLRLEKLSAEDWVREVDRLANYKSIPPSEALTLLGRRFAGGYLQSRRHIVWPMLEYFYLKVDESAWRDPLGARRTSSADAETLGASDAAASGHASSPTAPRPDVSPSVRLASDASAPPLLSPPPHDASPSPAERSRGAAA